MHYIYKRGTKGTLTIYEMRNESSSKKFLRALCELSPSFDVNDTIPRTTYLILQLCACFIAIKTEWRPPRFSILLSLSNAWFIINRSNQRFSVTESNEMVVKDESDGHAESIIDCAFCMNGNMNWTLCEFTWFPSVPFEMMSRQQQLSNPCSFVLVLIKPNHTSAPKISRFGAFKCMAYRGLIACDGYVESLENTPRIS